MSERRAPCDWDEESIHGLVERLSAMLTAQRLVVDSLVHVLSLEQGVLSSAGLLRVLDVVHDEIGVSLGFDDMIVGAFREHRDGLRQLILDGAIQGLERASN
ncbi:hypothetical protein [Microvirga pudoricolor]|uniref:hypothetical protein n=1 Tax=Microvirga pudoricolor TaxID=2778729 RepID=UPI001950C1E3|nr:hypothetical protein [Microvirga pudoricolor]MBM6596405.1 hypothetical protein [Microvirga pudoricolor]